MSAGMKSSRSTPLDGLAFLTSAITAAWLAAILARKAPSKSRVSTRLSASARMAAKDFFLRPAATSSRLTATILLRMSLICLFLLRRRTGLAHVHKNPVHDEGRHQKQRRDAQRDPGAFVLPQRCHQSACVKATYCASLARAAPLANASRARSMPSAIEPTTLAAYSAAPALSTTMSRAAPGWLPNTPRSMATD